VMAPIQFGYRLCPSPNEDINVIYWEIIILNSSLAECSNRSHDVAPMIAECLDLPLLSVFTVINQCQSLKLEIIEHPCCLEIRQTLDD